jgi:hypothetical protein
MSLDMNHMFGKCNWIHKLPILNFYAQCDQDIKIVSWKLKGTSSTIHNIEQLAPHVLINSQNDMLGVMYNKQPKLINH